MSEKTRLTPQGEFLVAPGPEQEEGASSVQLRPGSPEHREMLQELAEPLARGQRKMRTKGGPGEEGVAQIGDAVLTVRETLAKKIAEDMTADATRRHGRPLEELTFLELVEGAAARCEGRGCEPSEVIAELGRLQNRALYGDTVRRR